MTNERAREVATEILNRTRGVADVNYAASEAEAVILAYRDEVRREVLQKVLDNVGRSAASPLSGRGEFRRGILYSQDIIRVLINEADAAASSPINTGGTTVAINPTPERIQNVDRILREGRAANATRTDHDWIGAALIMLTRHIPAISDKDRAFWADVKREWADVG